MLHFSFHKNSENRVHGNIASDRKHLVLDDSAPFAVKEAYRAIYTNIVYLPISDRCRRFAVTSSIPGEGKSTVSINLAVMLAQSLGNGRVLLVDGDLRKSRIYKLLDLDKDLHGVSEYLASIDAEPNFVTLENMNGLSVLTSGHSTLNPAGLIESDRMADLLRAIEEKFDYVIFDTPPVNIVSDALLFNKYVNGYILVSRAGFSDIKNMSECLKSLRMIDAKILGGILICVKMKKTGGRKYVKYKKYGADGESSYDGYNSYDYGSYDQNDNK